MNTKLKTVLIPQPKSKIKANAGLPNGKYKFFTSSPIQSKFLNNYEYSEKALIFGTGGNASIHFCDTYFSTSTDCLVMYGKENINLEFIYFYLVSHIHLLEKGFKGAGLKHISKNYILNLDINIPSLQKQKEVVVKCKKIRQALSFDKDILTKYDELIKSRFIEMFGDPVSNPYNLPKLTLPELGVFGRGVSKHRPRNDPKLLGGKYPLIQTGEVANCDLYINEYSSTYTEFGLKQSKLWDKGTLCITIAANIAKTGILTFDACFPDSIVGFTSNEKSNNIFIHYWFTFLQAILEEQAPAAAQKNINLKILSELKVIIPPIELQNQFADFVQHIDKLKFISRNRIKYLEELLNKEMDKIFN